MENYSNDLQALINEDGVTVHRTPTEIMKAQLAAWDEVVATLEGEDIFERILESQQRLGRAGRVLQPDELGRLPRRLRPLLPEQARALIGLRRT